jgi:hypothetical protein
MKDIEQLKEHMRTLALIDVKNCVGYHEAQDTKQYEAIAKLAIGKAFDVFCRESHLDWKTEKVTKLRTYQEIRSELDQMTPNTNEWYLLKAKEIEAYSKL